MQCSVKSFWLFIKPLGYVTYGTYNSLGVRLLNRLRLDFSHFSEHKFKYNFANILNPLCSCSFKTEDAEHYFLRCQKILSFRTTAINNLNNINTAIASLKSNDLPRVILYGDESFNKETLSKKKNSFSVNKSSWIYYNW